MIKAKKGLLIALFAAMMMFAFGATSVFAAAGDVEWNSDFTSVKVENSDGTKTTYNQLQKTWAAGVVTVDVDFTKYEGMTASPVASGKEGKYYDLNNTEITAGTIWSRATFEGRIIDPDKCTLSLSGITMKDKVNATAQPDANVTSFAPLNGESDTYSVEYKYSGYDPDNVAEQQVTLSAVVKVNGTDATGSMAKSLIGSIPTKVITVQAKPQTYTDIKVDFDEITKTSQTIASAAPTVAYDGKEHTLVTSTVEGWTVAYALQDENGKYNDVDAVTVKDADAYTVKMTFTNAELKKTETKVITATVAGTNKFTFGFKNLLHEEGKYPAVAIGADPWDYVETSKLAEADQEAGMAYLKEKYTIEAKQSASDSNVVTWTIKDNDKYDATAAQKTYKDLLANYANNGAVSDKENTGTTTVTVNLTGGKDENVKVDEINFTEAPNMTYKYKKVLKKKSKSFTVEAVAVSGNAVSYRIDSPSKKITIDSATGKITVKKGLKKGTYKIMVKAFTEAGNGYAAANAERELIIKVKK